MPIIKIVAGLAISAMVSTSALADILTVEAVPTGWRLENYISNDIRIWYAVTVGVCPNGITFAASASGDDRNRLWATVMTAKATGRIMGIRYDSANNCNIASFYSKES